MISKTWVSTWGSSFFLSLLISTLLLPPPLWAAQTPKPASHSSAPSLKEIETTSEAKAFAQELIEKADRLDPGKELVFNFFHIEGLKPDKRLKTIIAELDRASLRREGKAAIRVIGEQMSKEKYDDWVKNIALPDEESVEQFLLQYETQVGGLNELQEDSIREQLSPQKIRQQLEDLKEPLFASEKGQTWMQYYLSAAKNKTRRFGSAILTSFNKYFFQHFRYQPDKHAKRLAWITSFLAIGNIALIRLSTEVFPQIKDAFLDSGIGSAAMTSITAGGQAFFNTLTLFSNTASGWELNVGNAEFWAINAIVFLWVNLCLRYQEGFAFFRSQGRKVSFDKTTNKLQVKTNVGLFTLLCILQEATLNAIITASQLGFGTVSLALKTVGNAGLNAVLAAYSYVGAEDLRAKWMRDADQVRNSDPDQAHKIDMKIYWVGLAFWNLLFPTFKNMDFYLDGWWVTAPFLALGSLGFLGKHHMELKKEGLTYKEWMKTLSSRLKDRNQPTACQNLLTVTVRDRAAN